MIRNYCENYHLADNYIRQNDLRPFALLRRSFENHCLLKFVNFHNIFLLLPVEFGLPVQLL